MIPTEPYLDQLRHWPATGRHILAHYDDESVIVYQAYRPSIGSWAVEHGALGGPEFSYSRMSWIKPNFLWMMYRSGWGTKPGQETTLALKITRAFFDSLLAAAVESAFIAGVHESRTRGKEPFNAPTCASSGIPTTIQRDNHKLGARCSSACGVTPSESSGAMRCSR